MKTLSTNGRMSSVIFWLTTYPFSIILGSFFLTLRITGRVRIVHPERMPKDLNNVIVAPNHPSLWEALLLAVINYLCSITHVLYALIRPHKQIPWSTPDPRLAIGKWYFFFLHTRLIWVPRGDTNGCIKAFRQMVTLLKNGNCIILFPEGGRTFLGEEFHYSAKGKRIRACKEGVEKLIQITGATVVPIWIEGADKVLPNDGSRMPRIWERMTIVIGEPIEFEDPRSLDSQIIQQRIIDALLNLADEP